MLNIYTLIAIIFIIGSVTTFLINRYVINAQTTYDNKKNDIDTDFSPNVMHIGNIVLCAVIFFFALWYESCNNISTQLLNQRGGTSQVL